MTEQDLIKFKNLSMQDGRLNLQWFADYVAQAEREEVLDLVDRYAKNNTDLADAIRARSKE